jgi:hypothetical protein
MWVFLKEIKIHFLLLWDMEEQLQIIADAETALQLEKECQAETETARKVRLEELRLVHECSMHPNMLERRAVMLGAPTHMGAVRDWNDVEPHHFCSAPAFNSGIKIDGGFLPPNDYEKLFEMLEEMRQEIHHLKGLVDTLVK